MTLLATGTLQISYTNLQSGKTITVNRSGPGKVTVFADGSELVAAKGPGGLIVAPPDAQRFGLPTVSVLADALTLTVDPAGNITSLSFNGHVLVNVCAALSQAKPRRQTDERHGPPRPCTNPVQTQEGD